MGVVGLARPGEIKVEAEGLAPSGSLVGTRTPHYAAPSESVAPSSSDGGVSVTGAKDQT